MTHLTERTTVRQATNRHGEMARSCQALLILIGIAREVNDLLYDVLTVQPRRDATKARTFRARPSRKRPRITSHWRRSSTCSHSIYKKRRGSLQRSLSVVKWLPSPTLTQGEASSLCRSSAVFVERDLEIEEVAACVEVSDARDVDGGSGNGI